MKAATNSSGWTGLPGGYRYSGGFARNGDDGYWWSASESGSSSWTRVLDYDDDCHRERQTVGTTAFLLVASGIKN